MKHYTTYVPANVGDKLEAAARRQRTNGINPLVQLILDGLHGKFLEQAVSNYPALLDLFAREDVEWVRVGITVPPEVKREIERAADAARIRRSFLVGAILTARQDDLDELAGEGRACAAA